MIPKDGADKFVFVDVAKLWTSCPDERKSLINSHAAKRMHLKRREKQKTLVIQKRSPTETSRGLQKEKQSAEERYQLQQPGQGALISRENRRYLLDPLSGFGRLGDVTTTRGYIPFCQLGSGQHDPFTINPYICSKDNHMLLHFRETSSPDCHWKVLP